MKQFPVSIIALGLSSLVWLNAAVADPTNPRPVTVKGTSLQDALNAVTVSGPGIDVTADQDPFARFTSTASGGAIATFIIEVTASGGSNEFGIYDSVDPTKKAKIFDGSDGPGDIKLVSFLSNGDIRVNWQTVATGFVSPSNFGFYVDVFEAPLAGGGDGDGTTLDYTVYTEDSLNDGGAPQALVYQGDDATTLAIAPFSPGIFTDDEFIIAFEDLLLAPEGKPSISDADYSDLVVMVESIVPVPAPAALLLGTIGLGLVGLAGRRFR